VSVWFLAICIHKCVKHFHRTPCIWGALVPCSRCHQACAVLAPYTMMMFISCHRKFISSMLHFITLSIFTRLLCSCEVHWPVWAKSVKVALLTMPETLSSLCQKWQQAKKAACYSDDLALASSIFTALAISFLPCCMLRALFVCA